MVKMPKKFVRVLALTSAFAAVCLWAEGALGATLTLEHLHAAYKGEINAHAKYLEFAKQADKEGYGEVASLFRAASRAEEIHAANHAAVIREMGGRPIEMVELAEVKSTRENLEAAIKGESYERDSMYPEFLKQARADHDVKAIRAFNLAKTAEAEHAKLYAEALANLDHLKGTKSATLYVCPVCGFTVRDLNFEKCPTCFTAKEKFEKVT